MAVVLLLSEGMCSHGYIMLYHAAFIVPMLRSQAREEYGDMALADGLVDKR